MMKLAIRRPRGRTVALTLAAACGLLAVTPAAREQFDQWLARYQLSCLMAAEGEDATVCAEALAAHGPAALPQLAEALTAPRAVVAQAAQQALQREIATWDKLPPGEANRRLRLLSSALAARVDQLGPSARQLALRQATRLLHEDGLQRGNSEVLVDCEKILRATASSAAPRAQQVQSDMGPEGEDAVVTRGNAARFSSAAADDRQAERALALPGGSLPVLARGASPVAAREMASDEQGEQSVAVAQDPERPESSAMTPLRIAVGDGTAQTGGGVAVQPLLQVLPKPAVVQASNLQAEASPSHVQQAGYTSPKSHASVPGDAEDGVTLRCMYQLHDSDPQVVATAEGELSGRGFGQRELELARRLTDDDPEVRRSLAEILPGISGIDAKLWLTWLSRDRAADVRLAALTVMATTGHAQMLTHVTKVARDDEDARIRKLGERLAETVAKRRSP